MTEQVTALAYNNERVVFANDRDYGILDLETKEETQLMMYNLEVCVENCCCVTYLFLFLFFAGRGAGQIQGHHCAAADPSPQRGGISYGTNRL